MSLISATALKTLDYPFEGEPFCGVVAKAAVSASGLDVVSSGEPFYAGSAGGGGGGPGGSASQTYIINT